MSKIRIKNFGPIKDGFKKDNGWMDIKKITVFIGNNGTGKSTIAKLISTFSWLEKALVRNDFKPADARRKNKFENTYCAYQGLKAFFSPTTEIEFIGTAYNFHYQQERLQISPSDTINEYLFPKIMYVPAERNFVSAVNTPEKLKYLPRNLYEFLDEFVRSQQELSEAINIPINNVKFQYNQQKSEAKIVGNGFSIQLSEASSGLQSAVPLFIVSKNLAASIKGEGSPTKNQHSVKESQRILDQLRKLLLNEKLTDEARKVALEYISSSIKNARFQNIVEEVEQNLFPNSQKDILFSLLSFNNDIEENSLVLTTHSPYIINYLTLAVKANSVLNSIERCNRTELKNKLKEIVPLLSTIHPYQLKIYEIDSQGTIIELGKYKGVPSDANYLNEKLAETNYLFTNLIEIEDLCQ